jgi:hypothetical protein
LQYVNENTTIMKQGKEIEWSTENIIIFSMWLLKRKEYGYSLLCIHGACLGIKVSTLLRLKWGDFIDDTVMLDDEKCPMTKDELVIKNEKKDGKRIYELSNFVQGFTNYIHEEAFANATRKMDDYIYINEKTGKVLSTSTLNRELNKLYSLFKQEVLDSTYIELNFTPLKTSTFEIAWARDMVAKYNYSKKIFILVSKHMGHRTVTDTINLLGIEPNDDVKICYDLFNPTLTEELVLNDLIQDSEAMVSYLLENKIGIKTDKFREQQDERYRKLQNNLAIDTPE